MAFYPYHYSYSPCAVSAPSRPEEVNQRDIIEIMSQHPHPAYGRAGRNLIFFNSPRILPGN